MTFKEDVSFLKVLVFFQTISKTPVIEIDNFEQIFYPCGTVQSSPSIFGRSRAERPRSQSKGGGHQGIFLSQKPQYIYVLGPRIYKGRIDGDSYYTM